MSDIVLALVRVNTPRFDVSNECLHLAIKLNSMPAHCFLRHTLRVRMWKAGKKKAVATYVLARFSCRNK